MKQQVKVRNLEVPPPPQHEQRVFTSRLSFTCSARLLNSFGSSNTGGESRLLFTSVARVLTVTSSELKHPSAQTQEVPVELKISKSVSGGVAFGDDPICTPFLERVPVLEKNVDPIQSLPINEGRPLISSAGPLTDAQAPHAPETSVRKPPQICGAKVVFTSASCREEKLPPRLSAFRRPVRPAAAFTSPASPRSLSAAN
ncbi:hypothetical protein Bbelb_031020 [Branchiostoma belcheri]|nr:hypothetical protein Bbelb_031020 [Branchiostoma belcheri]